MYRTDANEAGSPCRAFEALQSSSRCVGLVAFKGGRAIAHLGAAAADAVPGGAQQGELVAAAVATERGNYLANLILYPGAAPPPLPPSRARVPPHYACHFLLAVSHRQ